MRCRGPAQKTEGKGAWRRHRTYAGHGDKVKAGDTTLVIEAMKMENEMHTPITGEVKDIKEGDSVNPDEALIVVR